MPVTTNTPTTATFTNTTTAIFSNTITATKQLQLLLQLHSV